MRASAVLAALLLLTAGCSVPDGGDLDRLTATVAGWSGAARARALAYAMNQRAIDWISARPENDEVGRVMCHRDDESLVEVSVRTVRDVLVCLVAHPDLTYVRCAADMLDHEARVANGAANPTLEQQFGGPLSRCFAETSPRYQAHQVEDQLVVNPEAWTDEDLARGLIAAPGPLPGGPVPGLLPVLCPLAEDPDGWGCPEIPGGPPGQTPGDGPGGDR